MEEDTDSMFGKIIYIGLLALTVAYLITGFGIIDSRIVEPLTFGLLTKNLSFTIHNYLWLPFALFLVTHIYLKLVAYKNRSKNQS